MKEDMEKVENSSPELSWKADFSANRCKLGIWERLRDEKDFFDQEHGFLFWNPIGGRCEYCCRYCRTQGRGRPTLRPFPNLSEKKPRMVSVALGYAELWGSWICSEWINRILTHCRTYDNAIYTFMTKNPARYHDFLADFPERTILGVTIETNRDYPLSLAPSTRERMEVMGSLPSSVSKSVRISPIVNFDLDIMLSWIGCIKPVDVRVSHEWYGLEIPKPSPQKTNELVRRLCEIVDFVVIDPSNVIVGGKVIGVNHGKDIIDKSKASPGLR